MSVGEWVSNRVFTLVHRHNLVYNTCWEDPRLDREALELGPDDRVLVITSAGCNALDYVLAGVQHVYAVDMNPRQNALLELKQAGIRHLDYDTFFQIFGQGHSKQIRSIYESELRGDLSPFAQQYWDKKIKRYFGGRRTFFFRGTAGAFARLMNTYLRRMAKVGHWVDAVFEADSFEEQQRIYDEHLRDKVWTPVLRFFMGRDSTLSLVGVPRAQRQQIDSQYEGGIVQFVQDCVDAVFGQLPLADNYFWRAYTKGSYTPECCPEYLKRENFEKLKAGLVDCISTHTNTVEGFLAESDAPISRFVLLDHMDWLSGKYFPMLEAEWQAIFRRAAPGARAIWRSGGLRTDYVDRVEIEHEGRPVRLGDQLTYHRELAEQLHQKCRVHTYGSFYIADLNV